MNKVLLVLSLLWHEFDIWQCLRRVLGILVVFGMVVMFRFGLDSALYHYQEYRCLKHGREIAVEGTTILASTRMIQFVKVDYECRVRK